MYYIWDNYRKEWHDDYFVEYKDAEEERKMLIEVCNAKGEPHEYEIFQKIS